MQTLPFTPAEFLEVFARFNRATFFVPVVLLTVAFLVLLGIARNERHRDRLAAQGLAFMWLWAGLMYHLVFFSRINPLALGFGLAFIAQAFWFIDHAERDLVFSAPSKWRAVLGWVIIGYALVGYPFTALLLGHTWPAMPTFGTPCPVVLFTLGVLCFTDATLPKWLLTIPLLWAAMGTAAVTALGMVEDVGLPLAGLATAIALVFRDAPVTPPRDAAPGLGSGSLGGAA
jgi:hypothetical protein